MPHSRGNRLYRNPGKQKIGSSPGRQGKAFVRKTIDNPATHAHEISTDSSFSRQPMACLPRLGGPIQRTMRSSLHGHESADDGMAISHRIMDTKAPPLGA